MMWLGVPWWGWIVIWLFASLFTALFVARVLDDEDWRDRQ